MSNKGKESDKTIKWGIITTVACLLFNGIHFLFIKGSGLPIPSTLFNMIMLLIIIIVSIHQEEINVGYLWSKSK